MMKRLAGSVLLTGGFLLMAASPSSAVTLGFDCITNNNAADCLTGETQLFVSVLAAGSNQVSFTFTNTGPNASSITDVYFDDGGLLGIASITDGAGVDFAQNASPPNLPGANNVSPGFQTTAGFSADSEPPTQPNGVNPGEFVTIVFDLILGQTFANVLNNLADGSLRIGIHVQGFSGGGSEAFVNGDASVVPEPSTLLLIGPPLALAAYRRLRRTRSQAISTSSVQSV